MDELSPGPLDRRLVSLLSQRATTAVLATIDDGGCPWTTPVNIITPISETTIRMALERRSSTLANIQKRGRVMIAVLDEGDIAVGIAGYARVVRDAMETNPLMAVVEVAVAGVKDDTWPDLVVCQGIRTRPKREKVTHFLRSMFAEIRA